MHRPSLQPERSAAPPPPPPPAQALPLTVYARQAHPISEACAAFIHAYALAARPVVEAAAQGLARIGRNLR